MLSLSKVGLVFNGLILLVSARHQFRDVSNSTAGAIYRNPYAEIEARVSDLLARMSLQEKTAQLMQGDFGNWINTTTNAFNYSGLVESMELKANSFYVGYPVPQDWITEGVKKAQEYLVYNTTLGIPAFVQSEGIHGFLIGNATIFNSPIAYASSFNTELVEEMAVIIAQEASALGVNQLFAPVADLARELRFGRVEETLGEDPYLAGEMAYSYVKGLQSRNVSATLKHFAGFSAPEQGINTGPVHGGERELRTTWLPPFRRALEASPFSIMSAYHAYDGIPAVANEQLLTSVLRKEWGYEYYVISDAGGTDRLCNSFKLCKSNPIDSEAVTLYTLPSGGDVEMGGGSFNFKTIPKLVESGQLDIKIVDMAVSRVLRAKFAMGLFENPFPTVPSNATYALIHTPKAVELAKQLDAESIVLLENRKNILPLAKSANVAVIGPMADFMNFGDYVVSKSQYREDAVTPLQGIQNLSTGSVVYAKGCERWSNDQSGFEEAVHAALKSDVAVVVVGTWSRDQQELWQGLNATTGEHVDVSSLNLVGAMGPLVEAIINTGKPTVVVYSSGKPITEPWISENAAAVIQQFYPSEQGGNALSSVLYGDVNPSGKLSVGIPYDVGTLPTFYDYLNSAREYVEPGKVEANGSLTFGHVYALGDPRPLYEFGYGKSYSSFAYSNVTLSANTASIADTVNASVRITNNGTVDGKEVVQMYVQDVISTIVVPNKSLKGFKKVIIKAGETVAVTFELRIQDLGLWNSQMKYTVEPGDFVIWVGSSSKDLKGWATLSVK